MSPTSAVQTHALSKTYSTLFSGSSVQALDRLSLSVASGEIFGLLGPNGAGKTTLIKILLGVVRPTAGHASLHGTTIDHPEARRNVGYLPENHQFPDFLTAAQMLDLYGRMARVPVDVREQRIPALLERVRMIKWQDAKIKTFSKGMMQRLGLAQALLSDPALLFLDEPTDGVDPVGRREIRDLLLGLRDEGKTVFLNSHLLSEVEQVCTRVAILNDGRLVREGTVAELTAVDRTYELQCTPLPESLLRRLDDAMRPLNATDDLAAHGLRRYRVTASGRRELNALLDQLRQEQVLLEAVRPVRRTLEDYFIDVVQPPPDVGSS